MSVNLKEAVGHAKAAIFELFGDQGISNVMLEEVDKSTDGYWKVTIGFDRPADAEREPSTSISLALSALVKRGRKYKVVYIDMDTGEIGSVKERQFE